jgi:cell division septation protein DedD
MWSVQAAALRTRDEANALVTKLRARGYDARVDGTTAPFRVRFGMFPTRAAAAAALERFKAREKSDGFLVEVPRG